MKLYGKGEFKKFLIGRFRVAVVLGRKTALLKTVVNILIKVRITMK